MLAPRTTPLSVFRLSWGKTKRGHWLRCQLGPRVSAVVDAGRVNMEPGHDPRIEIVACGGERKRMKESERRKNRDPDDRPIGHAGPYTSALSRRALPRFHSSTHQSSHHRSFLFAGELRSSAVAWFHADFVATSDRRCKRDLVKITERRLNETSRTQWDATRDSEAHHLWLLKPSWYFWRSDT